MRFKDVNTPSVKRQAAAGRSIECIVTLKNGGIDYQSSQCIPMELPAAAWRSVCSPLNPPKARLNIKKLKIPDLQWSIWPRMGEI